MSSEQTQTTAPSAQAEPRLCRSGCGFFGSGATDNFCSKCFLEIQKDKGCQEVSRQEPTPQPVPVSDDNISEPMEVEIQETVVEEKVPVVSPKKKNKKTSYKSMMAAMTKASEERDIEKEKEKLRKVTGGGTFSKIDKI